ncbi:Hypothetical protein I596_2397 [Dokdonella koreensis DS-123]|uniref:Uncharacterized protein n=1 Tax=Dokdonella koreensis DS-123 TaxID=1300342 RepID=A0A160DV57_9GAMM|nr:Hypothetical protein I596_2397 [Dokdonella koreensis DS-123]
MTTAACAAGGIELRFSATAYRAPPRFTFTIAGGHWRSA